VATARVTPAANQQVADAIAQRLRDTAHLKHFDVDIACQNGVVELKGSVNDHAQRAEVLRIVRGVTGVVGIRDSMTVEESVQQTQAVQAPGQAPGGAAPVQGTPIPAPMGAVAPIPAPMGAPGAMPMDIPSGSLPSGVVSGGVMPMEPTPIMQGPAAGVYGGAQPKMPPYAWPTYAPYNNYSRVAHPMLYPYNAWPYIGPFHPFPKVPPGWRKVQLEWQDGYWWYSTRGTSHDWWMLRFW
jgi:hypothetical protein